ncbi:MAG: mechanosensitive ion channel [Ignavibacteriales bacterium]|nr:MAG: mechanosensitive ion channel [Ignavibacteriales bacterium]
MIKLLTYLREFLGSDLLYQIIISAVMILVGILLSKLVSFITKKIIQPFVNKTDTDLDDKLLALFESIIYRVLIVGSIYLSFRNLGSEYLFVIGKQKLNIETNYPYLNEIVNFAGYALFVVLIVVILIAGFRIINIGFDWYLNKLKSEDNRNLSGSLFPLLKKIVRIVFAAVCIVIVLSKFNVDISGLLVSLGVGSLAIALAAQDTLSNMISGFIIMLDRPFRIGDRIRFGANQVGEVVEIGVRSTKILDFDNNILIIPNNDIVKSQIVNITYPNIDTRVLVEVGVAYGSDIKKVRRVILDSANKHPLVLQEIPPEVVVLSLGDSSVNLRLAVRTANYLNAFTLQCELREIIYEEFIRENIEIPFPQRVVHVIDKNKKS